MTEPTDILLPNDHERRQLFYTLKRLSSYTAWNRIFGLYQEVLAVVEQSLREASAQGLEQKTWLNQSNYAYYLTGLADMEDGVNRLHAGDKRVFKYDATGAFILAKRPVSEWFRSLDPDPDTYRGGIVVDGATTPRWSEFRVRAQRVIDAWGECASYIFEDEYSDTPAYPDFTDYLQKELNQMWFPEPLPPVPDPSKNTLVRTGQNIPCSGIWEAVRVPDGVLDEKPARDWLGFLKKQRTPTGPFPLEGTMAYLHGGSAARPKFVAGPTEKTPTTWRLLWVDDRYRDGTIPEEEAHYVFQQPADLKASPPSPADVAQGPITAAEPTQRLQAKAGDSCPKTGRWRAPLLGSQVVNLRAGEPMPGPQFSDKGEVIWYWEGAQIDFLDTDRLAPFTGSNPHEGQLDAQRS